MKVVHFNDAQRCEPQKGWQRASLCVGNDISVEHFVKPALHASPMHAHPSAQVLVVLKGNLSIAGEKGAAILLKENDAVYIEGNEPHLVSNPLNEPSVGLDIFVPGRSFDFWLKKL